MFKEKRTANWNWRGWWRASTSCSVCRRYSLNIVEKIYFVEENFKIYLEFLC